MSFLLQFGGSGDKSIGSVYRRIQDKSTGLDIDEQSDYESWREAGQSLNALQEIMPFAIGDWIADGHRFKQYEHGFWDTVQETYPNLALQTLKNYEQVAVGVKSYLRRYDLTPTATCS